MRYRHLSFGDGVSLSYCEVGDAEAARCCWNRFGCAARLRTNERRAGGAHPVGRGAAARGSAIPDDGPRPWCGGRHGNREPAANNFSHRRCGARGAGGEWPRVEVLAGGAGHGEPMAVCAIRARRSSGYGDTGVGCEVCATGDSAGRRATAVAQAGECCPDFAGANALLWELPGVHGDAGSRRCSVRIN